MMVICTMIRMLLGIWVRIRDTARFEKAVTAITEAHITSVTLRLVVTASAEQIPRICKAIGLLLKIGSNRTFLADKSDIDQASLSRRFFRNGAKPLSPIQKLIRFSTPRAVRVAPDSESI